MAPSLETDSMDEDPRRDAPGFYLLDDAGGRFVVDPDFGFASLRDEATLQTERGAVHLARLRVVEPSGEEYVLEMRLKITGRVPQMLGPEEAAPQASQTDRETEIVLADAPWESFAGWRGNAGARLADEDLAFGVLLSPAFQSLDLNGAALSIEAPPRPSHRAACWEP